MRSLSTAGAAARPCPTGSRPASPSCFNLVEAELRPLFPDDQAEAARRGARVLWSSLHGIASLLVAQKLELIAGFTAEVLVEDLITTYLAGLEGPTPINPTPD